MSEVKVIQSIDPDCRVFQNSVLKKALKPENKLQVFDAYSLNQENVTLSEGLSLLGEKILKNLKRIPGIQTIFLYNEEIKIIKDYAFDWEDIEPQVLSILETLSDNPDAECSFENKELIPRCKIEFYPDDFLRAYHFNMFIFSSFWENLENPSLPINQMINCLQNSPMIQGFTLRRHTIFIRKNTSFEWEEMEKFLKPIFERFFATPVEFKNSLDQKILNDLGIMEIITVFKSNRDSKPRLTK